MHLMLGYQLKKDYYVLHKPRCNPKQEPIVDTEKIKKRGSKHSSSEKSSDQKGNKEERNKGIIK